MVSDAHRPTVLAVPVALRCQLVVGEGLGDRVEGRTEVRDRAGHVFLGEPNVEQFAHL